MPVQQLFTSRKVYDPTTFVAQDGKLFYNEATGEFRLGDGSTPGGSPIPITIATTATSGSMKPGNGLSVAVDGTLSVNATSSFEFNGSKQLTIKAASTSTLGAIKLGPGTELNGLGQLVIDPTGLDFAFGDFYAFTNTGTNDGACLGSINPDQDINIVSNGTGTVNIVGEFNIHTTNNTVEEALEENPIFRIAADGEITARIPVSDSTSGAVKIIGSLSGQFSPPINSGVMLHITGNNGDASRLYNDGIGSFAAFVARRLNGTVTTSTAVLANEEIMRLSGTAHNGTGIPGTGNQRIVYRALGNQTLSNQGGSIEFWATPLNTTTLAKVATVDNTDGITSTRFTGPLFGNVSGTTVTATTFVGTLQTVAQPNITSVGTLTNLSVSGTVQATTGTFTRLTGKWIRNTRDAGTIGAGGTLTIDFSTDSVVYCVWGDGMTINYQNYTRGSIVRVIARKANGTGVDTISLDGITAANVSSGSATSGNYSADTTAFIEFTCVGTTIGDVYAKF